MYSQSLPLGIYHKNHAYPSLAYEDLPKHKGLIYGGFEVEDMIGHCQVVFQSEGLQHNAVPHWEGKPQLIIFC